MPEFGKSRALANALFPVSHFSVPKLIMSSIHEPATKPSESKLGPVATQKQNMAMNQQIRQMYPIIKSKMPLRNFYIKVRYIT